MDLGLGMYGNSDSDSEETAHPPTIIPPVSSAPEASSLPPTSAPHEEHKKQRELHAIPQVRMELQPASVSLEQVSVCVCVLCVCACVCVCVCVYACDKH